MSKKRNKQAVGCLALSLIGAALGLQLIKNRPVAGIVVLCLVLSVGVLLIFLLKPRRCELCGNVIERKSHVWTIEGAKRTVCPHCNQSLARKKSAAATRRLK